MNPKEQTNAVLIAIIGTASLMALAMAFEDQIDRARDVACRDYTTSYFAEEDIPYMCRGWRNAQ